MYLCVSDIMSPQPVKQLLLIFCYLLFNVFWTIRPVNLVPRSRYFLTLHIKRGHKLSYNLTTLIILYCLYLYAMFSKISQLTNDLGHSACCISPSHQCSNIPSCCMSIYYNLVILKLNNNPLIVVCTLVNHYLDNLVSRATCTKTCVGVVSRQALYIFTMAGNNNDINIELRNPSLVNNYDRPDQSILHDIDPDYNYFNAINTVNSEYYNESSFNRNYGNSSNFSIFHLNIRSVISHFRELLGYLDTLDNMFKVIGLSETAINETSISYDIPSYNCEIDFRSARKGGGVSLYILDTLQYKLRNDLQLGGEVNSVFIEIFKTSSNTKRNIVCGCVYRPPSMSLVKFNELLSHMFGKLHSENKYIYIMGDFNVNTLPHIRGSLSVQEFKNIFAANYCFPLINKPTRLTSTSSSLIDNIYSTMPALANGCDSGILEISISDHYGIFTVDKNTTILEEKTETKKRSFCNKISLNFVKL